MTEEKKKALLAEYSSVRVVFPMKEAIEAVEFLESGWQPPAVRLILRMLKETIEE